MAFICLGLGYFIRYNIFQFHPLPAKFMIFHLTVLQPIILHIKYYQRAMQFSVGMTRSLCITYGLIYERAINE